ncbi:serine hydrolase domain-containing protein [Chlorogloeopsis sp. ULAP02]|uniref:serine hydrolase domain-containing protein n=1 Tax=Chlorogloeopsis sp. ULAP02 TaxID=3107926 RepID=UPI003135151B
MRFRTHQAVTVLLAFHLLGSLLVTAVTPSADAQKSKQPDDPMPVSVAKNGFTPEQVKDFISRYSYDEGLKGGDVSLWSFLNLNQVQRTATIARSGEVVLLEKALNPKLGKFKINGKHGELTLAEYLVHPKSRAQGFIVIHQGKIVFEEYPGMREYDSHVWMSNAKTAASLVIALLEADGKIDVTKPMETYLPGFKGSEWAGTKVIDILDMASGMDIVETHENRMNKRSAIARFNLATVGEKNLDGIIETQTDVVRSVRRKRKAGEAFEYSSLNTMMLVYLAEAVSGKQWADLFRERVWSKLTAEGDAFIGLSPDGFAQGYGLLNSRLRDLARYGLLHTPSWNKAAREKVLPEGYIRRLQTEGRKGIFLKGEIGNRLMKSYFPASPPVANSRQWDGVFADGDLYKGGVYGQGIYVSPDKDLVICWFSTNLSSDLTQYARTIALSYPASVK